MKIIDKYAVSENAPQDTTVGWFNPETKELKLFTSNGWESVVAAPPVASADTLGGVKVGEGLSVTEDGTLSASGGGNEPLVVEGTYSTEDYKLIPNNGQPSYNDIVAALNSGATVYVKAMSIEDEEEKLFTFAGIASSGWVYFTCVNFGGDYIALYDE